MLETAVSLTDDFAESQVFSVLNEFFYWYLVKRNAPKTLDLLSREFYSVGTGDGEIAIGKPSFTQLLHTELSQLPLPISYSINGYVEKERVAGCWDCFCNVETRVTLPDNTQVFYHMRVTAGIHREDEVYLIDTLHASEASKYQEEGEFYPLKFICRSAESLGREARYDLMGLIEQIMPGGIVGGYAEEGYPLYVANERLLRMTGYSHYDEFAQDIRGLVINTIHPDDRDYVNTAMADILEPGDQYEIEYRLRKKNGSYIWVHDIGRRTVAADGRQAIISVLIDISQQVYTQLYLEHEAVTDPLTEIYNRKGGELHIAEAMAGASSYLFLMLDLDNFKRINDLYGHKHGDMVLSYVARQLTAIFRKADIVCRLGGDEFAVFIANCDDLSAICRKVQQLMESYQELMQRNWPAAGSAMSVGGIYGRQIRPFAELYQLADEVLYEVKKADKGQLKLRIMEE